MVNCCKYWMMIRIVIIWWNNNGHRLVSRKRQHYTFFVPFFNSMQNCRFFYLCSSIMINYKYIYARIYTHVSSLYCHLNHETAVKQWRADFFLFLLLGKKSGTEHFFLAIAGQLHKKCYVYRIKYIYAFSVVWRDWTVHRPTRYYSKSARFLLIISTPTPPQNHRNGITPPSDSSLQSHAIELLRPAIWRCYFVYNHITILNWLSFADFASMVILKTFKNIVFFHVVVAAGHPYVLCCRRDKNILYKCNKTHKEHLWPIEMFIISISYELYIVKLYMQPLMVAWRRIISNQRRKNLPFKQLTIPINK